MIELTGKYNTAKVFTDNIDEATVSQVIQLLNQPFLKDSLIRIMPDCHAGKGCVVGTTMTINDAIVPNLVGVDIGCGMLAVKLNKKDINLSELDDVINKHVPAGFNVHPRSIKKFEKIEEMNCAPQFDSKIISRAYDSLGTLGGGNHFIEVNKDCQGNLWLVIHTGSRHLGVAVCSYYQNKAIECCEGLGIPKELCYLEGSWFKDYLNDMSIAQEYAKLNRQTIKEIILDLMTLEEVESFDTIHNYIDIERRILRKGAISAQSKEKVLIPMNMRDGSLICYGKGNPDWNSSAPHGAGRVLSRSQAKAKLDLGEFEKTMDGIYSTSVGQSTIDEAPMAYKPMDEILRNIGDETVFVTDIIKPIYNFKAH